MNKLEVAKKIIEENYSQGNCGLYDTRNTAFDRMTRIYDADGLIIDICYGYKYFEVFGLTDKEFEQLDAFYTQLDRKRYETLRSIAVKGE